MVDTAHFTGNQVPRFEIRCARIAPNEPAMAALAAKRTPCFGGGQCQEADPEAMAAANALESDKWEWIIPKTPLNPGYEDTRRHFFDVAEDRMGVGGQGWTHIRVNMFP